MCRASSKGRTRLLLEESMASCRRTLGEPKQNTGALGGASNSSGGLLKRNWFHKCCRMPGDRLPPHQMQGMRHHGRVAKHNLAAVDCPRQPLIFRLPVSFCMFLGMAVQA
jgi:hypothetical protein